MDSNSVKVENISFGGGAEGDLPPKGTLRIIKHIAANEEKVIPNVTFKLFKNWENKLAINIQQMVKV